MATTAELSKLMALVRATPGFEVIERSATYIVRNKQQPATEPLLISKTPSNETLAPIKASLRRRGWDDKAAEAVIEDERQARLRADREANDARMQAAAARAARQPTPPVAEEDPAAEEAPVWNRATEYARLTENAITLTAPNGVTYRKAVIRIDGPFAEELLKFNKYFDLRRKETDPLGHTNRPFIRDLRNHFTRDMLAGRWLVSHQGLAWDYNGYLLDGQHRLAAVYEAWQANPEFEGIDVEVTFDLDPDTFKIIDTGRSRRPTDILGIRGEDNRNYLASSLRLLAWYLNTRESWFHFNRTKLTSTELLDVLDANPGIRDAVRKAALLKGWLVLSSVAVGIYLIEQAHDDPRLDEFIDGVKNGHNLPPGDARNALRNWILKTRNRKRTFNTEQLGLFIKAWNDWITDTPRTEMKIRKGEKFPTPVEFKRPTTAGSDAAS